MIAPVLSPSERHAARVQARAERLEARRRGYVAHLALVEARVVAMVEDTKATLCAQEERDWLKELALADEPMGHVEWHEHLTGRIL